MRQREKFTRKLGVVALILALIVFANHSYATPNNQTHKLDSSIYHFKLDNSCRLKFNADWVYFGDSNGLWVWINDNAIKLYNFRMGGGDSTTFSILLGNANATLTKAFEDSQLKADVSSLTEDDVTFKVWAVDKPSKVTVDDIIWDWDYDFAEESVTVTISETTFELIIYWAYASPGLIIGLFGLFGTFGFLLFVVYLWRKRD